jgi:hypothetical protein
VCLHWYGARSWRLARSSAGFQTRLFRLSRSSVSVESMRHAGRVDHLRQVNAVVRFISAEPLLGSRNGLDLSGVSWLIAGGESVGSKVRALVECGARGLAERASGSVASRSPRRLPSRRGRLFFKQPIGLVAEEPAARSPVRENSTYRSSMRSRKNLCRSRPAQARTLCPMDLTMRDAERRPGPIARRSADCQDRAVRDRHYGPPRRRIMTQRMAWRAMAVVLLVVALCR